MIMVIIMSMSVVGLHFVSVENTKHIDKHFKELTSFQG
jgi:hypothetical protein